MRGEPLKESSTKGRIRGIAHRFVTSCTRLRDKLPQERMAKVEERETMELATGRCPKMSV